MNRKGRREEGGDFSAGEGKNSRVDGTGHHYGRNETSLGQLATGRCAFPNDMPKRKRRSW